ncbi:MAG: LysM domain-containing protein [Bacteroidota bacterium]
MIEGDSLESIADQLHFTPSQLAIWNNISPLDSLVAGQEIHYYRPIQYTYLTQRNYEASQWRTPWMALPKQIESNQDLTRALPSDFSNRIHFTITNKEKPADFLVRYPQVSTEEFLLQNQLLSKKSIAAGTQVILARK